jgi:hypothetical protein
MAENYVIWFEKLRMTDVEQVGGKNASLGEMISQLAGSGVRVPGGFALLRMPTVISSSTMAWLTRSAPRCPNWTSTT